MKLSAIICTHNPRPDYFQRVLDALKIQTLSRDQWELLLIDNASPEPLSGIWDLSWHPQGRHLREEKIGVAHARYLGMIESTGKIIVGVDDDNVLSPNYLEKSLSLAAEWTKIGVWSGSVLGEFEVPPPKHLEPYLAHLAVRTFPEDIWGNICSELPYGAGMGYRREVAEAYIKLAKSNKFRLEMGRRGKSLLGGEDKDIARTSHDLGLGTALFSQLHLTHLIPKRRLTDEYMLRLIQGNIASYILEDAVRGVKPAPTSRIDEWVKLYKHWHGTPWQRRVNRACAAGRREAIQILADNGIAWP